MEQKRKIKSLLPQRADWKVSLLTTLLLFLSVLMCVLSVSLITSNVAAQSSQSHGFHQDDQVFDPDYQEMSPYERLYEERYVYITEPLDYTWIDNEAEVLYAMRFLDPGDLGKIVNSIYMSGNTLYISPNPVIVHSMNSMENNYNHNEVWSGVYGHVLWWEYNKVYSDNVTLIAWRDNEITSWNDNAAVLWWVGNRFGAWKPGWIPMVILWWSGNVMWTGHDGNALIWWESNAIWENTSSVYILWWKNNSVQDGVDNVIVWWLSVAVSGVDNIFVFSNLGDFWPLTHNAFYLNLAKGVWLGVDSIYLGMAVNGAVNFGEIDITSVTCNRGNNWVVWSFSGCLVWCLTDSTSPRTSTKRTLLDIWERCRSLCDTYDSCSLKHYNFGWLCGVELEEIDVMVTRDENDVNWWEHGGDSPSPSSLWGGGSNSAVVNHWGASSSTNFSDDIVDMAGPVAERTGRIHVLWGEEPYGHCTKWVVDVSNAYRCDGTGAETLYSDSVVFETSLIDSSVACPSWENKCVYRCNSGYHLVEVSSSYECRPDCVMDWMDAEDQIFKYGEETVGFQNSEIECANASAVNSNRCSTYKKTLICSTNWKMYVKGTSMLATNYRYKNCEMKSFKCDSSYNLSLDDISTQYNDTIDSSNLVDRIPVQWTRWEYDVCMDYNWEWEEACTQAGSHFRFRSCKTWYSLVDGKCMKNCTWKMDGDTKHWSWRTFYLSWNVTCPGLCSSKLFTCNDGVWSWVDIDKFTYTSCDYKPKTCSGSYNVSFTWYQQWSGRWEYEPCEKISVTGNVCTWNNFVYKLTNCKEWYHTVDGKECVLNTERRVCPDKPDNSDRINGTSGRYTIAWSWTWNSWEWVDNSEEACQWACGSGYWKNGSKCIKIGTGCERTHYNCSDEHATVSNTGYNGSGYYWECQGNSCQECRTWYHEDDDGVCVKDVKNECVNSHPYGCLTWSADGRENPDKENIEFTWFCPWIPSNESNNATWCHFKCSTGSAYNFVTKNCECNSGYVWNSEIWECQKEVEYECSIPHVIYEVSVTWCYVSFSVYGNFSGESPRFITWNEFNANYQLLYSKDGIEYVSRSYIEQTSWNMNQVKLFDNWESWKIYLKLRSKSKHCTGNAKSVTVNQQSCSSSSSCTCPNNRVFYNGTCLNWQFSGLYSSGGNLLANFTRMGRATSNWWASCNNFGDGCTFEDSYYGNTLDACPDNFAYIDQGMLINYWSWLNDFRWRYNEIDVYLPIKNSETWCKLTLEMVRVQLAIAPRWVAHVKSYTVMPGRSCCWGISCYH